MTKENEYQTPSPKPTIYYGKEPPTTEHPSTKHWNRPYPPGNLWVRGVDKNGQTCWV